LKPIRTFEVVPFLPPELDCLRELAYNLRWTWDHEAINLFRRLDKELWETSGHNPVLMLGTISQERLNEAAKDEGFMAHANRIWQKLRGYVKSENTWYEKHGRKPQQGTIAYFSAEFGLTEAMPIYSGGLGILAGDHIKAASEQGLPLVGVGIAYQQGYFRQYLNPDGWQQERYPINDFYNMPITPVKDDSGKPMLVDIDFPGRKVYAQIWKAQVGRIQLFLLDTNISQNSKKDEDITDALYHGDPEIRIQQEMVLGIGGMRALCAMGIKPSVCHMNEGHSAFLALERIRMIMQEKSLSFAEAREVAAAGNVFTTHTAVPAGFDKFSPDLMDRYFGEYYRNLGISREDFLALGRSNRYDQSEPFSMAYLAMNVCSMANAVSRLHGDVSRQLFGSLWKDVPEAEVPITHITNGIHTRSWISEEMSDLYDRYLGPRWSEDVEMQNVWKRMEEIPEEEIWRIHERRRQRLVAFCRKRLVAQLEHRGARPQQIQEAAQVLDPDALTIGFARRVATYKRATLLLKDKERLVSILTNKDRPVQIIMAGKAHPEDTPAKELIRELAHFGRNEEIRRRLVFIEDYDMNVARWLVSGVDVWLNTPRRFLEACGTSGMKASFNGALNVSVLDGWWDEAYESNVGWAIGHGEVYADPDYQDQVESDALYDLLQKEIVPMFYEHDKDDIPRAWISKVKQSMMHICPAFDVNRMVREYAVRAYFPANNRYNEFLANEAQKAKTVASWKGALQRNWHDLKIESVNAAEIDEVQVGNDMKVEARVYLGELKPEDVSVQIYHGPIDNHGNIAVGESIPMTLKEQNNGSPALFSGAIRYYKSGRHGFTVRVLPHSKDLGTPIETGLIRWAG
jgi:starch phosphorylase